MRAKVIFHINEPDKWPGLLSNVNNLLRSYEGQTSDPVIEVLANGAAVPAYLSDGQHVPVMEKLAGQKVRFAACNNSLKGQGIAADRLASFVSIVPAGVRELADRQTEGYAYIKP